MQYFQRALKLDPAYLSTWTLLGHEYIEMKNTAAAIEAYRRAVAQGMLCRLTQDLRQFLASWSAEGRWSLRCRYPETTEHAVNSKIIHI